MQIRKTAIAIAATAALLGGMTAAQAATIYPADVVPEASFNWSFGPDGIFNTVDDPVDVWGQIDLLSSPTVAITNTFPRSGLGSLELRSTGPASKGGLAWYPSRFSDFGSLSNLTAVVYDWRSEIASVAPVLRLFLSDGDYDGSNHVATLVFMPHSEGTVTPGAWVQSDVTSFSNVWQSRSAGPGGQQTKSFADFVADPAYAGLRVFAVEVGFGNGYPADFVGAVDNVAVTTDQNIVNDNFEVQAAPAPQPSVPVPTLGAAGLLGLGALMAGIGAARRRRRSA